MKIMFMLTKKLIFVSWFNKIDLHYKKIKTHLRIQSMNLFYFRYHIIANGETFFFTFV